MPLMHKIEVIAYYEGKSLSPENSMQYHHGCGVLEFVVIQKLNFSCDMLFFES